MIEDIYKIGIIGGTGGIGKPFADYFRSMGQKVQIASRKTAFSPEECAKWADILIISVPIKATIETIKKLGPLVKSDSVIMDFTSTKTNEVKTMLDYSQAEVIGCHPIFGPSVKNFKEQVIVLTPARGNVWLDKIKALLIQSGALLKITTPEYHDKMMAIVQGLVHFTSIVMVDTLNRLNIDIQELNDYSSPVYRIKMDFAERILNQNSELYADIQLNNINTPNILKIYKESVENLFNVVENKNRQDFVNVFNSCSHYLGDSKIEAEKRTNQIIDFCASLKGESLNKLK